MTITLSKGKNIYLFHTVSPLEIALSIRYLSTMLKSGMGIEEAIRVVSKQVTDEKLRDVYEKILVDVQGGKSIAESMKKHSDVFSGLIISIIDVGEQGANLERNLIFLADYLKKSYELGRKIKGATTYPMIILGFTMVEMVGVVFFILPKLEDVFRSIANIPEFTKFVLDGAKFIRENWPPILVALIVVYFIFQRLMATPYGKRIQDQIAITIPVLSKVNKGTIISTFSRTLSMLLESGIPLQKSLTISQGILGNRIYQEIFQKVIKEVESGKNLADSLAKYPKFFPITYTKMIEVGEKTGNLEENLSYLYDFYTEEVIDMSNNLTTLLEPILLVFVGAMIGGLALLIITPIYQLTGSINV
jgi:type IV pilus assembly protein PilC